MKVAMGFLDAYGTFDAERARTYLADNADITGMTEGKGVEGLSLMLSFDEAMGYRQSITSCQASTLASDIAVVCEYDYDAIRSDEIGRGPYSGSDFRFTEISEGRLSDVSGQNAQQLPAH